MITLSESVDISTRHGEWTTFVGLFGDGPRTFVCGVPRGRPSLGHPLLRIQYGCAHGVVFQSTDCDCSEQINISLHLMAASDQPALFVYFSDHEAYGLGIFEKMKVLNQERRENKHFRELFAEGRLRPSENDILWIMPHLLDELGFQRRVLFLSDSFEKRRALEETGVRVEAMLNLQVDEAAMSFEALRHRSRAR